MNWILKQKAKALKERQTEMTHEFDLLDTKISMTSDHIYKIKEKSKTSKDAMEKKIATNSKEIQKLYDAVDDWTQKVLPKHEAFKTDQSEFIRVRGKLNSNSSRMESEIKWFKDNDDCPTCGQDIESHFKNKEIDKRTDKMMTNACALIRMDEQLTEMDTREKLYDKIEVDTAKKRTSMEALKQFNNELITELENISNIDTELAEDKTKLKIYKEDKKVVEKEKNNLTMDQNYYIIAKQLLQDSGIKTKIVRKYLPVMNDFINMYLNKLEFQVKFELDEEFNETIRSRYRDEFSYANFSEGEKMRIDLALLFTWRQIAKMKNSTNTNLLILDEIFDSSLDANGTDEFLKILNTLSDENVFLVSHKPDLSVDKFEHSVVFAKQNNFSRMIS